MKLGITDPTTGISVTVHDNDNVSIRIEGPGKKETTNDHIFVETVNLHTGKSSSCKHVINDCGTITFRDIQEATIWVQALDAMLKFVSEPFPPAGWTIIDGYAE
jgi:hypothetical protein